MIKVTSLSYAIEGKTLLDNISFSLPRGQLYGVIGHNGSGKSTLIRLLGGEFAPSSGEIQLDGKSMRSLSAKECAKHIAYLPQRLPDTADFLVSELVELGRFPYQTWLQKNTVQDKQIVQQAMAQTAVTQFADQPVNVLSGGEKQRVWLAMCLAQQTAYLLLDEPLAALDIVYQLEVMSLLRRLVDEQGLTVVIIIHDINIAAQFCDELIALKGGKLCYHAPVSEIMQKEPLQTIFGIDVHLVDHPTENHKVAVL